MMNKKISIFVMIIGLALIIMGLFTKIPGKELTTYNFSSNKYSVIEEYVGGDAYNYIIGASLVGGEIAGAKAQKAIFLSFGSLIASLGLLAYSASKEKTDRKSDSNTCASISNTENANKCTDENTTFNDKSQLNENIVSTNGDLS